TGKVVALAAELAHEAELGEIVLSTETAASVRETVAVAERAGAGESTGVRLVEVVPDAEPRVLRLDARLVGRDRELAALASAFASTSGQATCHLFTLLGEAGMGKSRLVGEFLGSLGDSATIAVGRCYPYGQTGPLAPLRDAIPSAGSVLHDDV